MATRSVVIFCLLLTTSNTEKEPNTFEVYSDSCSNGSLTCSELSSDTCPSGLFCKEGHCECLMSPNNIVHCNATRGFLSLYYCATYDEENTLILVGICPRYDSGGHFVGDALYQLLPADVNQLNNHTCNPLNKTGALCGRCLPDHYPLAYSYNMKCILCPNAMVNWLWYIMAAFLPLTVFYFVILLFSVNATSGHIFPLVFFCQAITMPIIIRPEITENWVDIYTKVLLSLAGISNLDFFRPFYNNLCLGIGILPTLALDYVLAMYPLLLIAITYLLITLYDRNYRVITFIIRPFKAILSSFKRNWNLKTSAIDAFATFFLLSNVKFLSVSFDFLVPKKVYQLYPDHHNYTLALYYAGDIPYFGKEHLPYAILAILMLFMFVLLPVAILALYPFSLFHKFINVFPGRWHITLHTFMDAFYCDYKDGTQPGIRDYRWWASTFYVVRIGEFILYSYITSTLVFDLLTSVAIMAFTTSVAILRPYKDSSLCAVHVLFLQILAATPVVIAGFIITQQQENGSQDFGAFKVVRLLCVSVLPLYYAGTACHWVYKHKNICLRCKVWRRGYSELAETSESLPDRIKNSHEYRSKNLGQL